MPTPATVTAWDLKAATGLSSSQGTIGPSVFALNNGAAIAVGTGVTLNASNANIQVACPVGLQLSATITMFLRLRQGAPGDYDFFGCFKGAGGGSPKSVWGLQRDAFSQLNVLSADASADHGTGVAGSNALSDGDNKDLWVEFQYNTGAAKVATGAGSYEGLSFGTTFAFTYGGSPTLYFGRNTGGSGNPNLIIEQIGFWNQAISDADRATISGLSVPFPPTSFGVGFRPYYILQGG